MPPFRKKERMIYLWGGVLTPPRLSANTVHPTLRRGRIYAARRLPASSICRVTAAGRGRRPLQIGWKRHCAPQDNADRQTNTPAGYGGGVCGLHFYQSRKSRSFLLRLGWRSLRRALASIWRIRSRVTLNSLPTSSSVRGRPSSKTKAQTQHLFLTRGQRLEHIGQLLLQQGLAGCLGRDGGIIIGDEVAQMAVLLLADGRFQTDRLLRHAHNLADLVHSAYPVARQFPRRWGHGRTRAAAGWKPS